MGAKKIINAPIEVGATRTIERMVTSMKIDTFRLLDSIDQYVFCKDRSGVYIYANEPFSRIAGFEDTKDIVGKTDFDLVWKSYAQKYQASDRQVIEGSSVDRKEHIQLRKEGSTRIIITKRPFYSDNGEVIGVVGNFYDIEDKLVVDTSGEFDEQRRRLYLEFNNEFLSFSEVKICFYLIHGFTAAKIAEKTNIAVSTVRYHIDNIKNKMGCGNKSEIPAVAMKTGIAWKILSLQHISELDNE